MQVNQLDPADAKNAEENQGELAYSDKINKNQGFTTKDVLKKDPKEMLGTPVSTTEGD